MKRTVLTFGLVGLLASGCSTLYKPLALDARTNQYPTTVQVDPGALLAFDTSTDPRSYRYVVLIADSNIRPSVLSFTIRNALAQSGITQVFSPEELAQLARTRGIELEPGRPAIDVVPRVAKQFGPVLVVSYDYQFLGDARFITHLAVTDASSGQGLLKVNHPRLNWANADEEALYPVLNQLRRWIRESAKGTT